MLALDLLPVLVLRARRQRGTGLGADDLRELKVVIMWQRSDGTPAGRGSSFRVYSSFRNSIQDWNRGHWRCHWRIRMVMKRGGGSGGESYDGREKCDASHSQ